LRPRYVVAQPLFCQLKLIKHISVTEANSLINQAVKAKRKVLVTGESGAGKNYIAAKAMKNRSKWFLFDQHLVVEDKKYVVSITEGDVKSCEVFVGVADNMEWAVNIIAQGSGGKLALFYVSPEPKLFREVVAQKAAEQADHFLQPTWTRKSKMSSAKLQEHFVKKAEYIVKKYKDVVAKLFPSEVDEFMDFVYIIDNKKAGKVEHGWHEDQGPAFVSQKEKEGGNGK